MFSVSWFSVLRKNMTHDVVKTDTEKGEQSSCWSCLKSNKNHQRCPDPIFNLICPNSKSVLYVESEWLYAHYYDCSCMTRYPSDSLHGYLGASLLWRLAAFVQTAVVKARAGLQRPSCERGFGCARLYPARKLWAWLGSCICPKRLGRDNSPPTFSERSNV